MYSSVKDIQFEFHIVYCTFQFIVQLIAAFWINILKIVVIVNVICIHFIANQLIT